MSGGASLQKYVQENVDTTQLRGNSFLFFSPDNTWRQLAYLVVNHRYFVAFIYVLIVINALTMALVTPLDDPDVWSTRAVEYADIVVLTIFTIEMLLKMLALNAFFGKRSYWQSSAWNKLDLVVIVGSFIGVFVGQRGFAAFRAFRAFRIFRALRFFKQLNNVMTSLRSGLRLVVDNSYFMGFFFILFGVLSVDLFQSSLRRWCVVEELYAQGLIQQPLRRQACKFSLDADTVERGTCPAGMLCVKMDNDAYNHGYSHMDDILHASVVIWQISTLSSWTEHLYHLQQSEGELLPLLYCAMMIFVLNFIVINLFVAVVGEVFGRVRDEKESDEHVSVYCVTADPGEIFQETRKKRVLHTISWGLVRHDLAQDCRAWGQGADAKPHERREEDLSGGWELVRLRLITIVKSRAFILISGATSVTNSAIMARYGGADQTDWDKVVLYNMDRLFFALLAAEVVLRFWTVGHSQLRKFLSDPWDAYDFAILIASVVSLAVYGRSVSFMRFRVLQVAYYYEGLKTVASLLNRAVDSIPGAASIVLFILLSFYVFGVAGVQFFAGKFIDMDTGVRTRLHFDHFLSSQLLLFRIMSGDTWEYYVRVAWDNTGVWGVLYIMFFFLFAVFVLLNLFTAVVLESFSASDEERLHNQLRLEGAWATEQHNYRNEKLWVRIKRQVRRWMALPLDVKTQMNTYVFERSLATELSRILKQGTKDTLTELQQDVTMIEMEMRKEESVEATMWKKIDHAGALRSELEWNYRIDMERQKEVVTERMMAQQALARRQRDELDDPSGNAGQYDARFPGMHLVNETAPMTDISALDSTVSAYSLLIFKTDGFVRRNLRKVVNSKAYEIFMIVAIVLSTVALALEYPREATWYLEEQNTSTDLHKVLRTLDLVWLAIFGADVFLNVVAHGLIEPPWGLKRAYLNDGWNILDFLLLISMALALFLGPSFKSFQALRTLRPVRVLRRIESIYVVVAAIWKSIGAVVTLCLGYCYLFLVLGIWSLIMFAGKMNYCNDATRLGKADCIGEYVNADGVLNPRSWLTHTQNFDSVSDGMLTLVEVTSLASWTVPMYNAMDITGTDRQPEFMSSPMNCLFFVFVIIVCSFYFANIFVAIILDSIYRQMGINTMTRAQRAWVDYQKTVRLYDSKINSGAPTEKSSHIRMFFHQLVNHRYFERAILAVVVINIGFMASRTASQPDYWDDFIYGVDLVCLVIYIVEMVAKMIGCGGVGMYLRSAWNRFDAFVIVGSVFGLLMERFVTNRLASVGVVRLLRVARVFRLMSHASGMKYLFKTLILSLPAIFNITLLLVVMMLIYAVFGKAMFGHVRDLRNINNDANFRSTSAAMGQMFRLLTLDNWHLLQRDAMLEQPHCTLRGGEQWIDDCGSKRIALMFYLSYYVVGTYIFINLILAVILDNFGHIFSAEGYCLSEEDIVMLDEEWLQLDVHCTGELPRYQVRQVLERLHLRGSPFGVSPTDERREGRQRHDFVCYSLNAVSKELTRAGKIRPAPTVAEDNMGLIFVKWRDVVNVCVLTYIRFFHSYSLKYRQRKSWQQEKRATEQAIAVQRINAWVVGKRVARETEQRLGWQFCLLKQIREFLEWKKRCAGAAAKGLRPPPPPFQRYAEIRAEMLTRMEKESLRRCMTTANVDDQDETTFNDAKQRQKDTFALARAGEATREAVQKKNEELLVLNAHRKAGDYAEVVNPSHRRRSMMVREFDTGAKRKSVFDPVDMSALRANDAGAILSKKETEISPRTRGGRTLDVPTE